MLKQNLGKLVAFLLKNVVFTLFIQIIIYGERWLTSFLADFVSISILFEVYPIYGDLFIDSSIVLYLNWIWIRIVFVPVRIIDRKYNSEIKQLKSMKSIMMHGLKLYSMAFILLLPLLIFVVLFMELGDFFSPAKILVFYLVLIPYIFILSYFMRDH